VRKEKPKINTATPAIETFTFGLDCDAWIS